MIVGYQEGRRNVNRRDQDCVVFWHGDFEGVVLHYIVHWAKVSTEGHADHLFTLYIPIVCTAATWVNVDKNNTTGAELDSDIFIHQIKQMT